MLDMQKTFYVNILLSSLSFTWLPSGYSTLFHNLKLRWKKEDHCQVPIFGEWTRKVEKIRLEVKIRAQKLEKLLIKPGNMPGMWLEILTLAMSKSVYYVLWHRMQLDIICVENITQTKFSSVVKNDLEWTCSVHFYWLCLSQPTSLPATRGAREIPGAPKVPARWPWFSFLENDTSLLFSRFMDKLSGLGKEKPKIYVGEPFLSILMLPCGRHPTTSHRSRWGAATSLLVSAQISWSLKLA